MMGSEPITDKWSQVKQRAKGLLNQKNCDVLRKKNGSCKTVVKVQKQSELFMTLNLSSSFVMAHLLI